VEYDFDFGYHIREAGSTAVQEVAFTLPTRCVCAGGTGCRLDIDDFAPQLSFFL